RENLDRVDLHPIEEGEGYLSLLETQAYTSHESIAKAFGKPKSRITECIGFTRLPDETKKELLNKGVKNRSLLRLLSQAPAEKHVELVAAATGKEADLNLSSLAHLVGGTTKGKEKGKAQSFKFQWKCDEKGISVPSFKWKTKMDSEVLHEYLD